MREEKWMNKIRFIWACIWLVPYLVVLFLWLGVIAIGFGFSSVTKVLNGEGIEFRWEEKK